MKRLVLILVIFIGIGAMNAQQTKQITFPEPCSINGPKWGPDSVKAVQSYSIYRENMKQWNNNKERTELIEYSLDSWRYLFNNAPLASAYIYRWSGYNRVFNKEKRIKSRIKAKIY